MSSRTNDKVKPDHYRNVEISPTQVIDAWSLNFYLGNSVKYICRAGKKEGETFSQDMEKAIWYLARTMLVSDSDADEVVNKIRQLQS